MIIDILCSVIDNYGDIGLVYRLAKALHFYSPQAKIRILTNDFASFHAICPEVEPALLEQTLNFFTLCPWHEPPCILTENRAELIIEAFDSGRPAWYENILYDAENLESRIIINLEYLSAETYVEEFHLLPVATPLKQARKFFFMPGFTKGSGGLLLDKSYLEARAYYLKVAKNPLLLQKERFRLLDSLQIKLTEDILDFDWLFLFTYEHNFETLVEALYKKEKNTLVIMPQGKSFACFSNALTAYQEKKTENYNKASSASDNNSSSIVCVNLPFIPQDFFDAFILLSDFLIVRGEESLARATLSTKPFVWHAYLQKEGYQEEKTRALVSCMRNYFPGGESFNAYEKLMMQMNTRKSDSSAASLLENYHVLFKNDKNFKKGFRAFAENLVLRGDLAYNLLSFIAKIR